MKNGICTLAFDYPAPFSNPTIGIVSPARQPNSENLNIFVQAALAEDFKVKIFDCGPAWGNFSAEDAQRARTVNDAINCGQTDIVLCSRGGYGSTRILDRLSFSTSKRKSLVGFSDFTAILLAAHSKTSNLITPLHGPMVSDLADRLSNSSSIKIQSISAIINPGGRSIIDRYPCCAVSLGCATGPLWGGNISMISALTGTNYLDMPAGAILILEDVDEQIYKLDRDLQHLEQAGILDRASGIIFADMKFNESSDRNNSIGMPLWDILIDRFKNFQGPVAMGLPFGHPSPGLALPLGQQAHLTVSLP